MDHSNIFGNASQMLSGSVVTRYIQLKQSRPGITKEEACRSIGISSHLLNRYLRETGNGNLVRKHTIHRNTTPYNLTGSNTTSSGSNTTSSTLIKPRRKVTGGTTETNKLITGETTEQAELAYPEGSALNLLDHK